MGKAYTYTTKSFLGHIREKDGLKHFEMASPLYHQHELNKFKTGEEVSIIYTSKKPKRTEAQNSYYWGVYLPLISAETGNDIDDLHVLFKGMFLSKGVIEVLGHKVRKAKSTTELTAGQFTEYIQRIEELTGVLAPPTENYVFGEKKKEIDYPEGEYKPTF